MTHFISQIQIRLFSHFVSRCDRPLFLRLNRILRWSIAFICVFVVIVGKSFADGQIGVRLRNDYEDKGASIDTVIEGSPADDAELETGSWITRVDNQPIQTPEAYLAITAKKKPGDKLRLLITLRDGSTKNVDVPLVDRATVFRKRELTEDERDALQELKDVNATIEYNYRRPAQPIVSIELNVGNITDDTIHCLSYLKTFQRLKIRDGNPSAKFTGKTFGELSQSSRFRSFEFEGGIRPQPAIHSSHLDGLATIPQLKSVTIVNDHITEASIQSLAKFQHIEELSLRFIPISDASMEHIGKLKQLKKLDLRGSGITGKSLVFIKEMTSLYYLDLWAPPNERGENPSDLPRKIQNDDLIQLSNLENLQTLDLSNSEVTNQGLAHLRTLKKLRYLELNDTGLINVDGTKNRPALSDDATESPKEATGITLDGLLENFKHCSLLELEVRGIEFENKDIRQMQKVWPKARIVTSRRVVNPLQDPRK